MFFLLFYFLVFFLLFFAIFVFSYSFHFSDEGKSSPFECGFISFLNSGSPFSMPFFIISLMFLLFDVEIMIVCFYPFFCLKALFVHLSMFFIVFLILLSTTYEWLKGILSWF